MAEALLSVVMEQLFSILTQQTRERIRLIVEADDEVQKLNGYFQAIQDELEDAEIRQEEHIAEQNRLEKLKHVSYDIEDALDKRNTAIQKLRIQKAENANSKSLRKVCSLFPCCGFCVRRVNVPSHIAVEIEKLNKNLVSIPIEKATMDFRLKKNGDKRHELKRPFTTSAIDVSEVHGRDADKDRLLKFLLSESSQGPNIPTISIVGMEGIGKTTLARLAYNDDKVKAHFDEQIWVCVSDPFDQIRIAKAILESLKNEAPNLNEFENVMGNIRQYIQGKKFLLVLDDVWTEDPKDWEPLKHSFMCGCPGSRILVTTSKEKVANVIGNTHPIRIGTLPENECWSLFSQIAFSGRSTKECEELTGIGEKIVHRCKGLPHAVKILGNFLRFKNIEAWERILDSEMWEVEEVKRGLFRPLLLSYYDLPSVLKKCFSYCAIFPKDYGIRKAELIMLWMGQGYLKAKAGEDMESVGEKYFETLATRSFFQDFEKDDVNGSIISCKMHDIVHDFAQFLTRRECFTLEVNDFEKSISKFSEKIRHSMIIPKRGNSFPISVDKVKNLRSLVVKNTSSCKVALDLSNIFDQLTCLRILHMEFSSIDKIPSEIENLIHLRYLDLSENSYIEELPEQLCELYNLQILNVSDCGRLQKLPQGIGKLINLEYLYCYGSSISYMPKGVERLTCLRRLENFVVSESDDGRKACELGCLKNFNHLKSLGIKGLGNLADVGDFKRARLNNKRNLVKLDPFFNKAMNEDYHEVVVEAVQAPPHLEILSICDYRGKSVFLNWLMPLTKLRILHLDSWLNCERLPPLGKLPSIESLSVENMKSIRGVGNEFLGIESDIATSSSSVITFPKLKKLIFSRMIEWEEWDYGIAETRGSEQHNYVTIMPFLRILQLSNCPKLKSMPMHLLRMTKSIDIQISGCSILKKYLDQKEKA